MRQSICCEVLTFSFISLDITKLLHHLYKNCSLLVLLSLPIHSLLLGMNQTVDLVNPFLSDRCRLSAFEWPPPLAWSPLWSSFWEFPATKCKFNIFNLLQTFLSDLCSGSNKGTGQNWPSKIIDRQLPTYFRASENVEYCVKMALIPKRSMRLVCIRCIKAELHHFQSVYGHVKRKIVRVQIRMARTVCILLYSVTAGWMWGCCTEGYL